MSKVIFRYRLDIADNPKVDLPAGAEVLSVGPPRDGADLLDLWALVHGDSHIRLTSAREFRIFGTGHPMPDDPGRFVGTVPTHEGRFIWHVFEVTS
jgi:hypothetical protein